MSNKIIYFQLLRDTFKFGKTNQVPKLHEILCTKIPPSDSYLNITTGCFNK